MPELGLAVRLRSHWLSDAADAGLRSSHGALVDMALSGPPTGGGMTGETATARAVRGLDRAAEHRTIERALASLAPVHRTALWLAYGHHEWPTEAKKLFRSMGAELGVVLLAPTAATRWRAEVEHRQTTNAVSALRMESLGPGEWLRLRAAQSVRGQVVKEAQELLRHARTSMLDALVVLGDARALSERNAARGAEPRRRRGRVTTYHAAPDMLVRL